MYTWIEELPVRSATKQLVECLLLDIVLPTSVEIDFGVDSLEHYQALQAILFGADLCAGKMQLSEQGYKDMKCRIWALDEALGNWPRLNALVQTYVPHYTDRVRFMARLM